MNPEQDASMARIDEMSEGLFQSEAERALAMLGKGYSEKEIARRIVRDRLKLESRFKWNGEE
jgi:hypothetical protein